MVSRMFHVGGCLIMSARGRQHSCSVNQLADAFTGPNRQGMQPCRHAFFRLDQDPDPDPIPDPAVV